MGETEEFKISFCTTCMDRLHHLEQTLPQNLDDSRSYDAVEFLVLNYNSKDNIDEWMKNKMRGPLMSGRLKYFKTVEPEYFHMAHAKNMITSLASGDIVCNIDADNFIGREFANYVNKNFSENPNIFLTGRIEGFNDLTGRVCLWKSDFFRMNGYNEHILDYGYEDYDLYSRLEMIGRNEKKISGSQYLNSIKHDNYERIKNGKYMNEIDSVLLFKSENILKAFILKVNHEGEFLTLRRENWEIVVVEYFEWINKQNAIELKVTSSDRVIVLKTNDNGKTYLTKEGLYERIPKVEACLEYSLLKGRSIFNNSIKSPMTTNANFHGFGNGVVNEVFPDLNSL